MLHRRLHSPKSKKLRWWGDTQSVFELSSSPCLLSPSPHLNSTYLLVLALFNMVCTSDKQELLEDIKMVILTTLLVETELKLELTSTVDTWLWYSLLHNYRPQHNQTLLDMLDHYSTISRKGFWGLCYGTRGAEAEVIWGGVQELRIGQIEGITVEFTKICSREGSMTDPIQIGISKDCTTNPTRNCSIMIIW